MTCPTGGLPVGFAHLRSGRGETQRGRVVFVSDSSVHHILIIQQRRDALLAREQVLHEGGLKGDEQHLCAPTYTLTLSIVRQKAITSLQKVVNFREE